MLLFLSLPKPRNSNLLKSFLSLLIKSPYKIKIIGDKSLSRRDFSRVVRPLKLFGVNFQNKKKLPIKISGSKYDASNLTKLLENKKIDPKV